MFNRVMGVDGGVTGAVTILSADGLLSLFEPYVIRRTNGKDRKEIDGHAFKSILQTYGAIPIEMAFFERGVGLPGQGGQYKYGFGNGLMVGIALALDVPYEIVDPVIWKRHMRLTGKTKNDSRARASELMPKYAHLWALATQHGRAEAALIAYYGLHR